MTMRPEAHGARNDQEHSPAGCDGALSTLIRLAIEQDPAALADFLVKRLATVLPSASPPARQAIEMHFSDVHQVNELRARKLVLVDDQGRDRARLETTEEGGVVLALLDRQRDCKAEFEVDGEGFPRLAMFGPDGARQLNAECTIEPVIKLSDPAGKTSATLAVTNVSAWNGDHYPDASPLAGLRLESVDGLAKLEAADGGAVMDLSHGEEGALLAAGGCADPFPCILDFRGTPAAGGREHLTWPPRWPD